MKATAQYFPVVLFINLYKVVLPFESVDDHSHKTSLAIPLNGAICLSAIYKVKFKIFVQY